MPDVKSNPIRDLRTRAGLTIKQLADLLNAPYRTIQDWDGGLHKPPAWIERIVLKEIEKKLKKSV